MTAVSKETAQDNEQMVSIIARGIADAQGDAYAEYSSEFDGYARAAVAALQKHGAGLSGDGFNVWGSPASIKKVARALYSDSIIEDVRTQARHWREEAGKLHAHRLEMLDVLKRAVSVLEDGIFDELVADKVREDARELVEKFRNVRP